MVHEPFGGLIDNAQTEIGQTLDSLKQQMIREAEKFTAPPAKAGLEAAELLEKVQGLAGAYTQVELLTKLVEITAAIVPRVLLLIRKGNQVQGWSGAGFETDFLQGRMKRVKWAIDDYPEITRVIHQKNPLVADFTDLSDLSEEIRACDGYVPFKSCFFPLIVKNKTAGILYVDTGAQPTLENRELVELYCYIVGLELTMVTSKLKVAPAEPQAERPKPDPPKPEPKPKAPEMAPPEPEPPSSQPDFEPGDFEDPDPQPKPVMTIPEIEPNSTPPVLQQQEDIPAMEVSQSFPSLSFEEDEDQAVKKARRVARVLVSDIKLYNEQVIKDVMRDGNLYERLKEDLDRSFQHYQERVNNLSLATDVNYFKEELIRVLGDGDPNKLGPLPF